MEVGRVGTEDYSSVPLTEPYVRFTHTAPWIDRSEPQRKLGRYRRRAGVGTSRLLVPRYMRQNVPPPGYVRWLDRSAPRRGCRRSPGPIVVVPSFSIHLSLRSVGFHRLRCYYEEIRLPRGLRPVVVASSGSTARAGPRGSPWVRTLNVPQRPPPLPPRPRLDFGLRVRRHARPAGPACSGVHSRSVPRFASGFFPTRPHGASNAASRRHPLRAVASGSRLLPTRPAKDSHLQSSAHARHTFSQRQGGSTKGAAMTRAAMTSEADRASI